MTNSQWKFFLQLCRKHLGKGAVQPSLSDSWCAFTTFASLKHGVKYWSCGFPDEDEILNDKTADGGLWSQSFLFQDIAHIVIPAEFYWENFDGNDFLSGYKEQDILGLSDLLTASQIPHRVSSLVLEVKLY